MTIDLAQRDVLRMRNDETIDSLLDALEEMERERDDAQAVIDAATSGARPESFLEHAQAILAKCVSPYSCEQMKAVGDALAGCYRKWELASEVAMKACEERDAAIAELAACKAKLAALVRDFEEAIEDWGEDSEGNPMWYGYARTKDALAAAKETP